MRSLAGNAEFKCPYDDPAAVFLRFYAPGSRCFQTFLERLSSKLPGLRLRSSELGLQKRSFVQRPRRKSSVTCKLLLLLRSGRRTLDAFSPVFRDSTGRWLNERVRGRNPNGNRRHGPWSRSRSPVRVLAISCDSLSARWLARSSRTGAQDRNVSSGETRTPSARVLANDLQMGCTGTHN